MTLDLHNNVRHQHIFNNAYDSVKTGTEWYPYSWILHGRRSKLAEDRRSSRESTIIIQQSYWWNRFMNPCQQNYITDCKLKWGLTHPQPKDAAFIFGITFCDTAYITLQPLHLHKIRVQKNKLGCILASVKKEGDVKEDLALWPDLFRGCFSESFCNVIF